MKTSKASTKVYALLAIIIIGVIAIIIHFNLTQPRKPLELPTRDSAIPADAIKMAPDTGPPNSTNE
jgi:hypothetical protein